MSSPDTIHSSVQSAEYPLADNIGCLSNLQSRTKSVYLTEWAPSASTSPGYYKTNRVDLFTSWTTKPVEHPRRRIRQWWKLLRRDGEIIRHSKWVEGSGSINPFVKSLFSGKAIATQAHPRNEDTIVTTQQPVKLMRAPSTRRKGTIKCMNTLKEPTIKEKEEDKPATTGGPHA
jgi:hypothetical protein